MMSTIYRTVVTVHHERVHEAQTAGEADLVAKRLVGSMPGIREGQIAQVISRPLNVVEQLQRQNLVAWQESEAVRGDPELYERWAHNLLPEEELLARCRKALFAPMAEFQRRKRMSATTVPHPRSPLVPDCGAFSELEALISWSTTNLPDIGRSQYARLARIADTARL